MESMRRWLLFLILLPFGLLAAVWLVHPWPLPLRWVDPGSSAYMEYRVAQANAAGESLEIRHRWVPLDEMPSTLVRAVLVAEDDRFREHGGVDWEALAEEVRYRGPIPPSLFDPEDREAVRDAIRYAREHRDQVRGRSTLTQQLARNLYLSPDRSFLRKGQELLVARRLEFFLSKDRILELYLNLAEFGPGIFGVGAAAEHYFGVEVSALNRVQGASLAATLPHPLTSNPATNPGQMAWRRDRILGRLAGGTAPVPPAPAQVEVPVELLVDNTVDVADTTTADTVAGRDTLQAGDTATAADTIAGGDTLRASDTLPPPDPLATSDTMPPPESLSTADTVPLTGVLPAPRILPDGDTAPAPDPIPAHSTLPDPLSPLRIP